MASPWLTVIVTLDEPLHVAEHPDPSQPGGTFTMLVGGLHTRPATIVSDGAQSGVQVGLSPLAALAPDVGGTLRSAGRAAPAPVARRPRPWWDGAAVTGRAPVLADVAARAGYYDQSHLDRDFRRFAGASPSRWLADELRNVHVAPPGPGESWTT